MAAVIGIDISVPYLQDVLLRYVKGCKKESKCVIIDESGYVIFHSELVDYTQYETMKFHIVEKVCTCVF